MTSKFLSTNNISWSVSDKKILDLISLAISPGETVGIVGPNGAGKTSLIKCLYGEIQPDLGDVYFKNTRLSALSRKDVAKKIAVVAQFQELTFDLSIFDIVHMGLTPHKKLFEADNSEDYAHIEHALNRVSLLDKQSRLFKTLSGGEQQRCLIARALVQQPQLLLMDEPTNHLDVFYQHQILKLIRELNITTVLSIHDLNLAAQYCDRLILLENGKARAFDTVENVFKETLLSSVFKLQCMVDTHPYNQKPRVSFLPITHHNVEGEN